MSEENDRNAGRAIGVVGGFPRQSYPPYDIVETENGYVINVAAAGFSQKDLSVSIEGNQLKIVGTFPKQEAPDQKFIHKGIAARHFALKFPLVDVEVVGANFLDGVLKVEMQKIKKDGPQTTVPINEPFKGQKKILKEA